MPDRGSRDASTRAPDDRADQATAQIGGDDKRFLTTKPAWVTAGEAVRIADLFAGCGGLTLGAIAGCSSQGRAASVTLAVEFDETTRRVYSANFPTSGLHPTLDVRDIFNGAIGERLTSAEKRVRREFGTADLLVGGPPCQGHSDLNNHTRRKDPKNALYLRMVRAAEVLRPSAIAIENVPGVVNDRGDVVAQAVRHLERMGFHVDAGLARVAELGVPQLRVRHVLLASRVGRPSVKQMLLLHRTPVRDLRWAIGDLLDKDSVALFDSASKLSKANQRRVALMMRRGEYDLQNRSRPECHRHGGHTYLSMYGRLRWDQPAQTITTGYGSPGQGRYVHPERARTITPHEAARLQFFPDWFDFGEVKTRQALAGCIGNAVPPKLGYVITRYLLGLQPRSR